MFIKTSYLTDSYIGFILKMESVSKSKFWSKNDGELREKWSRKKYFEIPPCRKTIIFITEFVTFGTFMRLGKVVSRMEEFQKYFF